KRLSGTGRAGMDGACHQLLPRSALSMDKHGAAGGRYGADGALEFFNHGALPDDVVQGVAAGGVAVESKVLALESERLQRAGHGNLEFLHQAWAFVDVIKSPNAHRLHGSFVIFYSGNQDD